ncbi:MAG: hypothetical protein ABI718_00880 [Acidobacteriota bacterium]
MKSRQSNRDLSYFHEIALFFKTGTDSEEAFMLRRAAFLLLTLTLSLPLLAKDALIPISAVANGANNTIFRSDVRIFNPSDSAPLVVTATFLKANNDNTSAATKTITIPARQMMVLNNIVQTFFNTTGLGAILLSADGEFDATSRLYTDSPNAAAPGTFGQFVPIFIEDQQRDKGALLQLSNSTDLTTGFRTNIGFMNPGAEAVTVAVRLISSSGTQLGSGNVGPIPPRSVSQVGIGAAVGGNLSFTDGYVSFSADGPVLGYASVVDNKSSDQIFVAAQDDENAGSTDGGGGGGGGGGPTTPQTVVVNVGPGLAFAPADIEINKGDTVKWVFFGFHSTTSDNTDTVGETWDSDRQTSGEFTHLFRFEGDWPYYCKVHSGPGLEFMNGNVHVKGEGEGGKR